MEFEKVFYPLSRHWYSGSFRFYYAYGNTPAQDFLQNCKDIKIPEILVLGCGDIRSCFYSLWKNFSGNIPVRFDGVHFLLNDFSAAVLARNVLFLYLCVQMPQSGEALKKWLSGMWAIWYCHELYPEHNELLNDSLQVLCKYADNWDSKDNPIYPLVKFRTPSTLNEIQRFWKLWYEKKINVASVSDMHVSRNTELKSRRIDQDFINYLAFEFITFSSSILPSESMSCHSKKEAEIKHYLQTGSVYAEEVLGLNPQSQVATKVNLSLYERDDGKYSVHYSSHPYSCYYQVVEFSKKQSGVETGLLVHDKHFKSSPYLANSVQQFSLWLCASHEVLTSHYVSNISFLFDSSSALPLCCELESEESPQKFDLIYTSNLMDHVGPPNLVLSTVNLLKDNGLLFTTTLSGSSLDEYLSLFGFNCKYFPILLGVRCINHEGEGYASPVTIVPSTLKPKLELLKEERLLIWEKVSSHSIPLIFSTGQPLTSELCDALHGSIKASVYSLFENSSKLSAADHLCVETAIKIIQAFMSNTCADFSPQFWKPLCDLMQESIKPYLNSMQTQLLLHGIHMHLTVNKESCPLCLKVPLSTFIGLFSTNECMNNFKSTPKLLALVHREDYSQNLLDYSAIAGKDVHVFDCVSTNSHSETFYFYAPIFLAEKGYKVRVTFATFIDASRNIFHHTNSSLECKLEELSLPFASFKFFQGTICTSGKTELPSFGSIGSHISTGDNSTIEINLLPEILKDKKLKIKQISSKEVCLYFGENKAILRYAFPVDYNKINIKEEKIVIQSSRAPHDFLEEQPILIFNPEKELSLSKLYLSNANMHEFSGQQFTKEDRHYTGASNEDIALMPPLLRVKQSFLSLFQRNLDFFVLLHPEDGINTLIFVNNRWFDYETRSPVIDLAVCFLQESFEHCVMPGWRNIAPAQIDITVDDIEFPLLKKIFAYFANRTNGTCSTVSNSSSRFNLLKKVRIQNYFSRAVLSLLLCDPDQYYKKVVQPMKQHDSSSQPTTGQTASPTQQEVTDDCKMKCYFCSCRTGDLKKCSRCKKVSYCGKECQKKDWPSHKANCRK